MRRIPVEKWPEIDPLWNQIAKSASITVSLAILFNRALDAPILWTTREFLTGESAVISAVSRKHSYLRFSVDYEILIQ